MKRSLLIIIGLVALVAIGVIAVTWRVQVGSRDAALANVRAELALTKMGAEKMEAIASLAQIYLSASRPVDDKVSGALFDVLFSPDRARFAMSGDSKSLGVPFRSENEEIYFASSRGWRSVVIGPRNAPLQFIRQGEKEGHILIPSY